MFKFFGISICRYKSINSLNHRKPSKKHLFNNNINKANTDNNNNNNDDNSNYNNF